MPEHKKLLTTESKEEDLNVIRSILSGNIDDFKFLQNKYYRIIKNLIRKMIKNEDDVNDLTQETFIKAYNGLSSFQHQFTFSSWLFRIASNNCIDFLRKRRFPTISLSQPTNEKDDQIYEVEDKEYIPDKRMLTEERRKLLLNAIEELPLHYKEIIRLRHEEDMDYNQIAEKLNIPLGTVKAHLFRARKLLLQSLNKTKYIFNEI